VVLFWSLLDASYARKVTVFPGTSVMCSYWVIGASNRSDEMLAFCDGLTAINLASEMEFGS
jgi:hypothetical protein